jgi:hypothetical protein
MYKAEKIYICFVGEDTIPIDASKLYELYKEQSANIVLQYVSKNLEDFELPTLQFLYDTAHKHPEKNILYLHTKGVGKPINPCIEDWVEYMCYFNIEQWKKSNEMLLFYDTCGVDLYDVISLHYSGNFWWAKASYILTLPPPNVFRYYPNLLNSERHNQEFWICHHRVQGKFTGLWNSQIDCFQRHLHLYPRHNYQI